MFYLYLGVHLICAMTKAEAEIEMLSITKPFLQAGYRIEDEEGRTVTKI